MKAQIALPPKLIPVFTGEADVRGAYGGRGSGKTRSFAKMTAVRAHMWAQAGRSGQILCTRQFMNSLDDSSLEEIKEAIRIVRFKLIQRVGGTHEEFLLKQVFDEFDVNRNGQLCEEELHTMLIKLEIPTEKRLIKPLLEKLDVSGNGAVEYD